PSSVLSNGEAGAASIQRRGSGAGAQATYRAQNATFPSSSARSRMTARSSFCIRAVIQPTFLPAKSRPKRPNGTDLTERAQHRGAFMQQDVTSEVFGQSKPAGRLTTHANPTYEVEGVTHYCVADMPGAVPLSAHWPTHQGTHESAEPHGQRRNGLQHVSDYC